ncbi:hypothetical protein B0H11DRAFT_1253453 [Mycena galericulata]|nr:hypothetical protein B0H11DRAFT_1253453 [Mycena galericulata]
MQNGWTRFPYSKISNSAVSRVFHVLHYDKHVWLSQATHVLSSLHITSNYEEYGCIGAVKFKLELEGSLPDGYLILCPFKDLLTPKGSFKLSEPQVYWSLDASGIQKLGAEEALNLGFPVVVLKIRLRVFRYEEVRYTALRQFHQAKGFNPDSQDVARHLEYPLYQIYPQTDTPFAHVQDKTQNARVPRFSELAEVFE